MKKIKGLLLVLMCFIVTGCSNEFAEREYDSNEKIAETKDHYSKSGSVFNTTDGEYTLTVSEFDGRETFWTDTLEENENTEIECSPETSTDGFVMKKVALKSGKNRLKIVGYDCEDVDLKMVFSEP